MRILAKLKTFTLAAIFAISLAPGAQAQTKNDAAIAYNNAAQLAGTDLPGAVKAMTDVISMCDKVGADANDVKDKAQKLLPGWNYQIANNFLKDKKIDDAQVALEKSLQLADLYKDADIKDKASKQLAKVYFAQGNTLLKGEKTDDALVLFDKAIGLQANYAKAYFSKGQALKKKAEFDKMKESMDQAITYGKESGDTITVNNAKMVMRDNLVSRASKAVQKGANEQAIGFANSALTYSNNEQNKDAFYLLAVSYNKTSKWDNAIEAANKGLALEEGAKEKKALFFFELGNAQKGKGETTSACASFKNAAFGVNAKAATDMLTKLGCK